MPLERLSSGQRCWQLLVIGIHKQVRSRCPLWVALQMLSAGLIGGPGLGYGKDRFAGEALRKASPELAEKYKSEKSSSFLNLKATEIYGLDGTKLAEAKESKERTPEQQTVVEADQQGDRHTLRADSFIPATMAVVYLLLMLYFKSIGGYKPLAIGQKE